MLYILDEGTKTLLTRTGRGDGSPTGRGRKENGRNYHKFVMEL
jgi:hypothetical protein